MPSPWDGLYSGEFRVIELRMLFFVGVISWLDWYGSQIDEAYRDDSVVSYIGDEYFCVDLLISRVYKLGLLDPQSILLDE